MEDYIALLLLVVPGFIARKVYKQTNDVHEMTDQFTETLYCLLNSMAIFIIIFARIGILSFTDLWAKNLFDWLRNWIQKIAEIFGGLPRFRGTYINGQTGITIKEYDVSVLFPYYKQKETDSDQ